MMYLPLTPPFTLIPRHPYHPNHLHHTKPFCNTTYHYYNTNFRIVDAEISKITYVVTSHNTHHARCADMADQQILNPSLFDWFKGLMEGGPTATKALSIYEEAVFGGTKAAQSELLSQQVLFFIISRH